jgi:transcriptional regulator with XRE-family HTH domain
MDISSKLKKLRNDKGYSFYKVNKMSGISGQHIKGMEEGTRQPTIETLQRLLNVYGTTLSEFFNENEAAYFPTAEEKTLLDNFRAMDDEKSAALLKISEVLIK